MIWFALSAGTDDGGDKCTEATSEFLRRTSSDKRTLGMADAAVTEQHHNPNKEQLEACSSRRKEAKKCCEQIKLVEEATSHVGTFKYLGSVISEKGGMGADIKSRITQSRPIILRTHIWE